MELFFLTPLAILAYVLGSIPSAVWIGKAFYNTDVRKFGSGNAGTTNVLRILGARAAIPVFIIDLLKGFVAVQLAWLLQVFPQVYLDISNYREGIQIVYGILAVVGHMFPVFAGFRGGKGVATMLGVLIAIHPLAALSALLVFLIVFAISKYVSLGSLCAAVSFPIFVIIVLPLIFPPDPEALNPAPEAWPTSENREQVTQAATAKASAAKASAASYEAAEHKQAVSATKAVLKIDGEPTLTMQVFSIAVCLMLFFTHRANIRRLARGKETKTTLRKPSMVGSVARAQASARKRAAKQQA